MTEVLALLSALCFGLTHFVNGVVSRTWNGVTVAAVAQVGGTVLSVPVAVLLPAGHPTAGTLWWGALSGLGTGVGVAFLYRAMSRGPMSVVAPVSDLAGVALPVVVGVTLLHERPSPLAVAGILLALVAVWLVSRRRPAPGAGGSRGVRRTVDGVPDALLAGVGIAAHFVAVARIPAEAGAWPLAVAAGCPSPSSSPWPWRSVRRRACPGEPRGRPSWRAGSGRSPPSCTGRRSPRAC
ncbi:EamA family transporter [Promicromonospora sp. NPDC050880]|uniref:EamA family transporter n=1 Tax=Promicromonospora sp. NPDC050880 TaxID=3364406 RepID=UPI00379DB061